MSGYGWYLWQPPAQSLGRFSWVPCDHGQLPPGAVPAGRDVDGSPLFAGRAYHEGDLLPAKVRPDHMGAYVCWGGMEHRKEQYEVLVSGDAAWKPSGGGQVPPQAMVVGQTAQGEPLYLGRAHHQGALTPGKVHPSHGCIYIPFAGEEVSLHEYEILVLL